MLYFGQMKPAVMRFSMGAILFFAQRILWLEFSISPILFRSLSFFTIKEFEEM